MREHKATGQARASWTRDGRERCKYFGKWGSRQAADKYRRFMADWAAGRVENPVRSTGLKIGEFSERYLEHAEAYYRKNGRLTSEIYLIRAALWYAIEFARDTLVSQFEPKHLRQAVAAMIAAGLSRPTVNAYHWRILRMFTWGRGQTANGLPLVSADTLSALVAVERQAKGRSQAAQPKKKRSVPASHVEAIIRRLHPDPATQRVFADMVRLHLLLGCRPGELVAITPESIERGHGDLWRYEVRAGKMDHTEAESIYWIGPRAQKILGPYLGGDPAERVFRFGPVAKGAGRAISRAVYANTVARAVKRENARRERMAGPGNFDPVPHWHPHRLRHNRATEVRRAYEDSRAAAAAIGDSPDVAEAVYTDDPGEGVAKRIAREIG